MGLFDWLFGKKDTPDDECIACGSKDLHVLAPGVYRCHSCRYEGGENRQHFEKLQKLERLRDLPQDEKRRRAQALMESARLGLIAARGDVTAARKAIPSIVTSQDRQQEEERARSLSLTALTSTLEVVTQLEDVMALTGSLEGLEAVHERFQGGNWKQDIAVAGRTLEEMGELLNQLKSRIP